MTTTTETSILSKRETTSTQLPSETGSTERVRKLHALLHATPHTLCLRRARIYTQVFKETEGEPRVIRFAKALSRTLDDLPAYIDDDELIVGGATCRTRAAAIYPEVYSWLRKDIDTLGNRDGDPFKIQPGQVEEVKEILAYWQDKTLFDMWLKTLPPEVAARPMDTGWADVLSVQSHGYHFTPPFELLLEKGLVSYEKRARAALDGIDPKNGSQMGREQFYQALLMTTAAIKRFADKYAALALNMAGEESNPKRQQELRLIADVMSNVPYHGARSFHEAVQTVFFTMALLHVEGTGPTYALGRIDQYLYPFYRADLDKGLITREQAQEFIELLFLKLTGIIRLWSTQGTQVNPGYKPTQAITLGGVDASGKDASDDLTYIILDAAASVRTIQPDVALLIHPRETPHALKLKAAEMNALGMGIPKFFNTETLKTQLMDADYTLEEARVGWIKGCSEPYGPGCQQQGYSSGAYLNLAMSLECVFFNGRKRTPGQAGYGQMIGLETGDPRGFKSFDEFLAAFKKQVSQQMSDGHIASCWVQKVRGENFPLMIESLFTEACIERGLTAHNGGARINTGPGIGLSGGIGTVADSLAAIKKLVYEDKKISMDELLKAIDANFEGYEELRQTLINQAPKYGNDDDYVDDIAREVWHYASVEARKLITHLGNRNTAATVSPMSNMAEGTKVWATPDGRKAGAALSNHFGPTDGRDMNGPIGNLNSVSKLDLESQWGSIHNLYLVNIRTEADLHRVVDLVDIFFSRGGTHLQLNCQDKKVFIAAQKNPERYRGLMVRVAGYVAYFVELPKVLQDQIIGRTSHSV